MKFRQFFAVYLAIVIGSSAVITVIAPKLEGNHDGASPPRFSIRWMSLSPTDHNNSHPEYTIAFDNLTDNQLKIRTAFQIKNQEPRGYYFLIDGHSAPAGWTFAPHQIGYISNDETKTFVYENITRTLPSPIPQGRLTETITIVIKTFYNDSYTGLYKKNNLDVTFNFLDLTSAAWTILYHDNFDDGTTNNWESTGEGGGDWNSSNAGSVSTSADYYTSFQYSLRLDASAMCVGVRNWEFDIVYPDSDAHSWVGHWVYPTAWVRAAFRKTFAVGDVAEAYLLFSIKSENYEAFNQYGIKINGTTVFMSDVTPQADYWHQFAIPLSRNSVNTVDIWVQKAERIGTGTTDKYAYLDDVYLITK